ncbi:MAG: sigma 54-interacting transcriptional regulator [Firmicutes bacterium]|nr:sigma 54-interacting transcriptional regulator [Bacillota bacterium]
MILLPGPLCPKTALDLPDNIRILEAALDEAAAMARELERQGVEVIISRGGTGEAIRKAVTIPVVAAEVTSFDVLETIWGLKKEFPSLKRIGLMNFGKNRYDTVKMSEIVGLSIEQFWYEYDENHCNLAERVREAFSKGIRTIVGGLLTVQYAKELGMHGVVQQIGRETTLQAVQKACEIADIRRRDREKAERLRAILNFIHEGVVSVDHNGVVTLLNPAAEKIFNIRADEVIGKPLSEVFPDHSWEEVIKDGKIQINRLHTVRNVQIVVNRIPIIIDQTILGAVSTFQKVDNLQNAEQKIRKELYAKGLVARFRFEDVIGRSLAIKKVIKRARLYAQTDTTVLISGESGTGKEVFAQSIHQISSRREGPFVAVNCAALPETLLESELFGYEEGAFTGAKRGGKAGMFELAHNGTIFLDEIGEMPIRLQARLLRVIQQKEVMRVGGEKMIPVNVRIIAATNRDLWQAVEHGEFREDLYYWINVLNLRLPSLRERPEDIPMLIEYFIDKYSRRYNKKIQRIPESIMNRLTSYHWPGNVRELENFTEKLVILSGEVTTVGELVDELFHRNRSETMVSTPEKLDDVPVIRVKVRPLNEMEDEIIQRVHEMVGGNKSEVAQLLGISRTTVWKKTKNLS